MHTIIQAAVSRKRFPHWVLAIAIGFALCGTSALGQRDVHARLIAVTERKPAPVFHLTADDGRIMQPSNYRGRVVLLNFWATKCGGCVLEIPAFIELENAYGPQGFTAVGISADIPYEGLKGPEQAWSLVRPFLLNHKVNYPVLMGDSSTIDAYGFQSYPATYLLDKSGRIAATYEGIVDKADVETNIKKLLTER
jgi:peroxiredoxin